MSSKRRTYGKPSCGGCEERWEGKEKCGGGVRKCDKMWG